MEVKFVSCSSSKHSQLLPDAPRNARMCLPLQSAKRAYPPARQIVEGQKDHFLKLSALSSRLLDKNPEPRRLLAQWVCVYFVDSNLR